MWALQPGLPAEAERFSVDQLLRLQGAPGACALVTACPPPGR